ncbi:gamma-glutamyl-gamma-aminobutyrate hydrolase family protein [Amnibacterium kyonggiense]|uniref:Putative glutamine amidotransferase n=1 Tax=Amnibacterium kyonggiense TaxID=595671 RepID=A0A4R7FJD4_9MICO|nr:gamma-glutamyl-gamma-aminobutyrate hydrolase family protein [Amnibacterium kyonggiense]TDS76179.1 putative glutamine amidotransferase [Amnibacterium kyonggiense]
MASEYSSGSVRRGAPLIGVTTYLEQAVRGEWDERFGMVPETYLIAVEEGGGIPVMLPPQPFDDEVVERVLGAVDGLVVSGGADVDPARYGAERGPHTDAPRHDRDGWEIALVLAAIERDLPVLAICRGVQLLNVALGGTLVQHVPDVLPDGTHGGTSGGFTRSDVRISGGTLVREVLGAVGDRLSVHCHHHQVLDRVADGLVVAAHAADGLVEAVELPSRRFVVGVQWHPEQDEADRRLFAALARAAS